MRKSLITTAVLGALAVPSFVFAADAAPAPDLTVAYNIGLYSQYIFRGLTQTNHKPALQGGVDLTHSSGLYLGAWGSNISWLTDGTGAGETKYYKSGGSLELDIYGGYRYTFANGLGIDIGALQYYYPGTRDKTQPEANTTELYGAVSYGWLQAKFSDVVSDAAWGFGKASGTTAGTTKASGTYYAELNATIPVGDLVGGDILSGVTAIAHIGRQEFDAGKPNDDASYTDYKLGLQKAFANGVNVGGYWTDTNNKYIPANNTFTAWKYDGKNIGESTGTVYLQKTF
jgi:uncharacterized protein (TIGR02001 family)